MTTRRASMRSLPLANSSHPDRRTASDPRGRRWLALCLIGSLLLAVQACGGGAPAASPAPAEPTPLPPSTGLDTESTLESLGGYPCLESGFTCIDLEVPLDHTDPANPDRIEVVFAVLPASGERRGMFVTAVGGPGGSGLAVADSYTAAFDPAVPEHFDIVFFDQRGVAASGDLQCVEAATEFYRTEWDARTAEGEAALLETARRFADQCVAEMGQPDMLPFLGTEQAAEDLEVFRQAMGDERFWLYGESYGTQYAQTYAAAHPDRLAGLILDGPVDLTVTGLEYYAEQAQAFNDVLLMTLEACAADQACVEDMGGDPQRAYDDLAALLAGGPRTLPFPLASGETVQRSLGLADLETAAASYLYSETARLIFLRALAAAAAHDDLVPMARVLYDSLYLDPETLDPVPDPSFSDAIYYAVECRDYAYASADGYLRAGDAVEAEVPRLASIFYGDLPCPFWPTGPVEADRPAPLEAVGFPTLVMVGTADPATPRANAERIVAHLADGYLVTEEGGPHIIFGWGNACVDELVTTFLVDGQVPAERTTVCPGVVVDDYLPLPPVDAAEFADPLEALASVDNELYYMPEYYYWDLETPRGVGCPYGGGLTFEPSDPGEAYSLTDCAFSEGFVMSGTGSYTYDAGIFELTVDVTGLADGSLVYTRTDEGTLRVHGVYAGGQIDLGG